MSDTIPAYKMQTCRAAIGNDADSLAEQVDQIEQSLKQYPAMVFVVAKGFLDSVCKTVLLDLGISPESGWDTPKLVKEAIKRLQLVSPTYTAASAANQALAKINGGLSSVVQGLCELRNHHSPVSHGQDAHAERLDERQALLVAQAVDVLAGYIYRSHRESIAKAPASRVYYSDYSDFNDEFDSRNDVVVVNEHSFAASWVLYNLKRESYRNELVAYLEGAKDIEMGEDEEAEDG